MSSTEISRKFYDSGVLTTQFSSHLTLFSPAFEEDVQQVWDYENSVEQYQATGGTCKQSVLDQCLQLHVWIDSQ